MSSTDSPSTWDCPRRTSRTTPAASWPRERASARLRWPPNLSRVPANLRVFLPDPEGAEAYPIVTFSWLLLNQRYTDPVKAEALKRFVAWGLAEGQSLGPDLGYIRLPAEIAELGKAALAAIN